MKNFVIFAVIINGLFLLRCEREKNDMFEPMDATEIVMGSICGWCAGGDSIIITSERITYKFNRPCDENDYSVQQQMNSDDWVELLLLFDWPTFKQIDINTCNVCADGCDTWISVRMHSDYHLIRYGFQDSLVLEPIKSFVNKLDSLRNVYRQ